MVLRGLPSLLAAAVALPACAAAAPSPTTSPPTVTVAAPASAAGAVATSDADSPAAEATLADAGSAADGGADRAGDPSEGPFAGIKPAGGSISPATTPKLRVRSAVLVQRLAPNPGRALVLSEGLVACVTARIEDGSRKLEVPVQWMVGQRGQFSSITLRSGFGTAYQGTYQILLAPTGPNALGWVRIEPGPSGNVEGGTVTVQVCP